MVLDQLIARDKETVDGWKDELNNLLIFVRTLCVISLSSYGPHEILPTGRFVLRSCDSLHSRVVSVTPARLRRRVQPTSFTNFPSAIIVHDAGKRNDKFHFPSSIT